MNETQKTLKLVEMFHNSPSVTSQLPVILGDFVIEEHNMPCNQCGERISDDKVHGYVNVPMPNTASFHSVGVCVSCEHITESVVRIKSLGKNTYRYEKINVEGKWVASEIKLKDKHPIVAFFLNLLGLNRA